MQPNAAKVRDIVWAYRRGEERKVVYLLDNEPDAFKADFVRYSPSFLDEEDRLKLLMGYMRTRATMYV